MTQPSHDTFAAFVGIAWADAKHDVCLQPAGSAKRACFQLEHTPEAIDAWVTTLRTRFHGQPVASGLELNKGPMVSALRKYDFLVLFPRNPLTLARYREAFTPSRAKDDPTDAALQLARRLPHRDKLQPLKPQSPTLRALAQLVEHRRRVVGDKVRLTNRLPSTRKNYFPQGLHWFQEKDPTIFCDFLSHWPTLKAVPLARRATLEPCFRAHHVRYADVIAQRIEAIKSAPPLTTDAGVSAPNALLGQASSPSSGAPCRPSPISTPPSRRVPSAIPTFPASRHSPGRLPFSLPVSWAPLATSAHGLLPLQNCKTMPGSRRCPNAAARRPGGTGGASAPSALPFRQAGLTSLPGSVKADLSYQRPTLEPR